MIVLPIFTLIRRQVPYAAYISLPVLILLGAIVFNAALALMNAQVQPVPISLVVLCELLLVAAAHLYALHRFRPEMRIWYALIGIFIVLALYRSLGTGNFSVKYLRDVMIIPTFVLLGIAAGQATAVRAFLIVHLVICAFAAFEAVNLDLYSEVFNVRSYYINTRGLDESEFTTPGTDLYISAMRPESRFFGFVDLHRVSSVFLEPVSLGNYTIIATILLCAWRQLLTPLALGVLGFSTFLLMIGCDGRLAFVSVVVILATFACERVLPRNIALLWLPGCVLLMVVGVSIAGWRSGADDFPGRLAYTVELLEQFGWVDLLGLSNRLVESSVDSGVAYLTLTQSIFGLGLLWCFIVFALPENSRGQQRLKHGVCLYLVLTMTVSYSFLTIKTAALLWSAYGAMICGLPKEGGEA